MEKLPEELWLHIFCWLDHQNLATAQLVSKKWEKMGSKNELWSKVFKDRWGEDAHAHAHAHAPIVDCNSWKHVYEVQDRCDRVGLGLKIIREGGDYYLVHQGQIQRYLGSNSNSNSKPNHHHPQNSGAIFDKILFFIGDLETDSKRARTL